MPLRKAVPYEMPLKENNEGEIYQLDPKLVDWAYQLTRNVDLGDTEAMRQRRAQMTGLPNAQQPPRVILGDTLQSSTFWHGKLLNQWANDWIRYYSKGAGNYVTTAMEDTGTLQSLTFLAKAGKVDLRRALVLRTASNFDSQRPGLTAWESLAENKAGGYAGFLPAVESAWKVGSVVVRELSGNWKKWKDQVPQ